VVDVAIAALTDDQIRYLGVDSPAVLDSRHEFALWRATAGARAEAVPSFTAVLADRRRVPASPGGPGLARDAAGARQALLRLCRDCDRILSPGAPLRAPARRALESVCRRPREDLSQRGRARRNSTGKPFPR